MIQISPRVIIGFKFCGVLPPEGWSAGWKRKTYSIYTLIIFTIMCTFLISEAVSLFVSWNGKIEDFADNTFMLVTTLCCTCKFSNLLKTRCRIMNFVQKFNNDPCKPNSREETEIQNKFDRRIRCVSNIYQTCVSAAVTSVTVSSLISRNLPFKCWIPFDCTTIIGFWCAYTYENLAHAIGAIIGFSYDILFCNLLSLACAQLKLLERRYEFFTMTTINQLGDRNFNCDSIKKFETILLRKSIQHHLCIFEFTEMVQKLFGTIIFIQCTVSTFVLCLSTYLMTFMKPLSLEFVFLVVYIICMLAQIFLYCSHGNEIMLESNNVSNVIYAMDWPLLNVETQKKLILIMARSSKPITFKSGKIIVLSLETYKSLLKLSYSVYNLLCTSE